MTPQDIKEKTFEKALVGGYDMGSVDDFLEKVAADLTASQKDEGPRRQDRGIPCKRRCS